MDDPEQLVFSTAPDAKEHPGLVIIDFDERGAIVPRNPFAKLFGGRRKRIGVLTRQHRQLDVTGRLHHFLEERLLQTGETIRREKGNGFRFTVDMSIGTDGDAETIARAHWHPTLRPFDYFNQEFGRTLKNLLEAEAERSDATIDQNIAANHLVWQKQIADTLSQKFKVSVTLRFRVPAAPSPNVRVQIGAQGSASQRFLFKDSVDEGMIIPITAYIAPNRNVPVLETFPKEEFGQRDLLFNLIYGILSEDFLLGDYWYDVDGMTERLTTALNVRLAKYGRRISSLAITGYAGVPAMQVRAECNCSWRDAYGVDLPFPVMGFVSVSREGAGKYQRAGRPDREALFKSWIDDELRRALAGMTVVDLSGPVLEDLKARIGNRLAERAREKGLMIEPFLAEPRLPFENWTRFNVIEIDPEPPFYNTAHPKISAEFSTSIRLKFSSRRGLKPFVEQLEATGDWTAEEFDARVESQLKAIAVDAIKLVMQGVSAEEYFSNFTRWNVSLSSVSAPALDGESQVRKKIIEMLKGFNPYLEIDEIRFHRKDTAVEKLRHLIGRMGRISVDAPIKDRRNFDRRYDRTVTLHVDIVNGVPDMLVSMLMSGVQDKTEAELRVLIQKTLKHETEIALDKASYIQLESLIDTLTVNVDAGPDSLRSRLVARLQKELREVHGLETRITMSVGLTDYEERARTSDYGRAGILEEVRQTEAQDLFSELKRLTGQRAELTDQSPESLALHERLTKRIEAIKRQLTSITKPDGPSGLTPIESAALIGAEELLQITGGGRKRNGAQEDDQDAATDASPEASSNGRDRGVRDAPVTLEGEVLGPEAGPDSEAGSDAGDEDSTESPAF